MASITQTYTSSSTPIAMLQHSHSSSQSQLMSQNHRNSFHAAAIPVSMQPAYRPAVVPIQPYAFTATPSLHAPTSQRHQSSRTAQQLPGNVPRTPEANRTRMPSSAVYGSGSGSGSSKRDSVSSTSMVNLQAAGQSHSQTSTPSRPQPDRYRRGSTAGQQKAGASPIAPIGTNMTVNGHMYHHMNSSDTRIASKHHRGSSVDQTASHDLQLSVDEAKRMRRRSIQTLDFAEFQNMPPSFTEFRRGSDTDVVEAKKMEGKKAKTLRLVAPIDMRSRSGSFESASSNRSAPTTGTQSSAQSSSTSTSRHTDKDKPEFSIPPRGSSNMDSIKRAPTPSPLSGNVKMAKSADKAAAAPKDSAAAIAASAKPNNTATNSQAGAASNAESPAAQKLAAINQGGKGKTKTSRLRRAFSFGSVTEFRRAAAMSAQNQGQEQDDIISPLPPSRSATAITRPQTAGGGTLRNQPSLDNVDEAEQERIAKKQEASGLGNNIYGPRIFGGSTDNLSISSTASSASVMIRKMGRGMKRGGRSLVGLFRPKSMIGTSTSLDSTSGVAEISMVNAEAERQRGVPQGNLRVAETPARTSSPLSERAGSSGTDSSSANKNTDAQSGPPKGILKRRGGSPNRTATDSDGPGLMLPEIPAISDSPNSSAPSTPNDDAHKRVGGVAIGNEDYFVTALKLRQDGAGSTTPRQAMKRNATFSPRIVFHDTWPSQEYDRRGEVATCNRLTPLLAQQIKEELNSFKMEMEVHENSKIYTHFF